MGGLHSRKVKWLDLELKVYKLLKDKVKNKKILIAVSGGVDSVALLHAMHAVKHALNLNLYVAHIHHGLTENNSSNIFRDKAHILSKETAGKLEIPFHSVKLSDVSEGEASLREGRLAALEILASNIEANYIAFAHHENDLLETRLIRIIRGVGHEGLPSMSFLKGKRLRPLIGIAKDEILVYAKDKKIRWIDDPSNLNEGPLRNWIRASLLPLIEQKRAGSAKTMARSLQNLSERPVSKWTRKYFDENGVFRGAILELSHEEKRQVIASYLQHRGQKNYSMGHIEELLKRLDSPEKSLTFRMINRQWMVNAEYIEII